MWSLSQARRAITLAGCFAAVFNQLTTCAATIAFVKALGGNEWHIGILGSLPVLMLFCQFIAAVMVNHLTFRRRVWFWSAMAHRLLILPVALGAVLWRDVPGEVWVWSLIVATAISQGLLHFSAPLWLSWMGDYLPHQGLSEFWGARQFWTQWSSALSLLVAALLMSSEDFSPTAAFVLLTAIGTLFGATDLLLFAKIEEPPVKPALNLNWRAVLFEPFKQPSFRSFITFTCFWHFATMVGAPFISLYLMTEIHMSLFQVLLLWTFTWIGGALCSHQLGRLAERYGARAVLIGCVMFKSINMICLLMVPAEPVAAFWQLIPSFMLDQVFNAGILIANNAFMIKHSPTANRTMYIAASTALAGVVGGITSIASGAILTQLEGTTLQIAGRPWSAIQLMFLASIVFRWMALIWVQYVTEPAAARAEEHLAPEQLLADDALLLTNDDEEPHAIHQRVLHRARRLLRRWFQVAGKARRLDPAATPVPPRPTGPGSPVPVPRPLAGGNVHRPVPQAPDTHE